MPNTARTSHFFTFLTFTFGLDVGAVVCLFVNLSKLATEKNADLLFLMKLIVFVVLTHAD